MNLRTIVDESETPKPSPLFQLQAAVVTNGAWPLDSHVTQQIFSIAGVENLPNISFTSRLFNRNANALAKRILIEKYKINCGSLPNSSPIPLLCKVIPYYDVLERPISTASTYC